jgi:hypothetical protein
MSDLTVTKKVHFQRGQRSRKAMREGESKDVPEGRVPRVARLMALAIRFDRLIRDGVVSDQAELARPGRVSRARVSQIMNLLQLAPDIQEAILFLPLVKSGREPVTERDMRPIAAMADWRKQRRMWAREGGSSAPITHFSRTEPSG